jgi:hypothetical protein
MMNNEIYVKNYERMIQKVKTGYIFIEEILIGNILTYSLYKKVL